MLPGKYIFQQISVVPTIKWKKQEVFLMLNFPLYLAEVCLLIIFRLIFSYMWLRFAALFIFLLVFQLYLAEVRLLIIFLLVFHLVLAEVCLIIFLLLNFPLYLTEFALLSSYLFSVCGWDLPPYYLPIYFQLCVAEVCLLTINYLPTYFKLHVAEVCLLFIFLLISVIFGRGLPPYYLSA